MNRAPLPVLARPAVAATLMAALLSACSKSDKIPTTAERLASVQQQQETDKNFYEPRKSRQYSYLDDMKNLKDATGKPVATPASASQVDRAPAPVAAAPVSAPVAAAPAPVQQAPAPTPQPVAQQAPPPVQVAAAVPTPRPAAPAPSAAVTVLQRESPDFPREASRAGIDSGTVRARITINAAGEATNVAIITANPPRVFDRAVQNALSRWKFNPGADGRTYDTEVAFSR
ncbi:MAG: energy transducer TonB [Betaproteobacteria bacterium]|nr:energy transducer TonB [Betaproteobacteria bacterium]